MAQSCFLYSVENNEHTGRFDKLCSLAAAFLFGLCLSLSHVVHILKCVFCLCGGHRLVKGSRLLTVPCGSCPDITVMVDRHSSDISRSALLVPTSVPCFGTTEPWKLSFKFLAYVSFSLLTCISFGVITIISLCVVCVCMQLLYKKHAVEFLLDVGDTVHAYEERGRSRDPGLSELELEQSALSQMNHVQKIEVLQGERWLPSSLLNDHFSVAILAAETRTF